jgi:hypothetical protein
MTLKKLLTKYRDIMWRNALWIAERDESMAVIYHTRADTLNDVVRMMEKKEATYLVPVDMGDDVTLEYGEWPESR